MSPSKNRSALQCLALVLLTWWALGARAELTIEITTQSGKQVPLAIVPFYSEASLPQTITSIIKADLFSTGLFREVDAGGDTPFEPNQVDEKAWRGRGAEAVVIGKVVPTGGNKFDVRFYLMDMVKGGQLASLGYNISANQARRTAHQIADEIYKKLTGDPGVFSTKIAYVVKQGTTYQLKVADADGFGEQEVLRSREPVISPSWSPDGTRIAYVTFEDKKPVVVVQSLQTGLRVPVANFKGSNSAPAWSPDGKRLAVTLTKDGSSQIYLIAADGKGNPVRLTQSPSIDTEPAFSPDGRNIVFTSDRGGRPQIYRISVEGGEPQRVTFGGGYNVSPQFSPDGKKLIYVQQNGDNFRVMLQDLESGQAQVLTDTEHDESPTFAPNGKMILYATQLRGRGVLATVSSDGRVRQRLFTQAADVREPTWGPFLR